MINGEPYQFLDFFAGSGLVTEGVKPYFKTVWANDISEKKAAVYLANQDKSTFHLGPVQDTKPFEVPSAAVSWASFPCQDLSLAGKQKGINGQRSGLVWTWLSIMDQMTEIPPIVVAENVSGLASSDGGSNYRSLHEALVSRGYRVGPLQLDALLWVPQSRKRIFVIGVKEGITLSGLIDCMPNWLHPACIKKAVYGLNNIIWWKLPSPPTRTLRLSEVVEWDAPLYNEVKTEYTLGLIPSNHKTRLENCARLGLKVFPGYKRIRNGVQALEIRTDDVSGCLRTANGGSSRQFLVLSIGDSFKTRLLTVREAARLMGIPDSYVIPGNYNSGYNAIGDAVALPVTRFLAKNLLLPLARRL